MAKQDKFDWKLIIIIVLYMLKVGLTFFLFNSVTFEKIGTMIIVEIISAIIIAVIAAILSIGHISRCLIGVFVWTAGIFALIVCVMMDTTIGEQEILQMARYSLAVGAGLLVIQLVCYGVVKLIKPQR